MNRTLMKTQQLLSVTKGAILCIGILFFCSKQASAQDLHYSQFYNSPLNLNPAKTGIFNGDQRYIGSVRDQWRFVPVPWLTFSASYDMKIYDKEHKHFFGVGGNFNYDRQGDSRLNLSSINFAGSYTRVLNASNLITGGVLVGFNSRGFNTDQLTWDKQWNGLEFDPNLDNGENFDLQRLYFIETGAGLNYRWQKSSRTKVDVGVGAYHLVEPTTSFYNVDTKKLPRNYTFSAIGSMKLSRGLDLQLQAMHQIQDQYNETLFGGLAKIYVSQRRGKEAELHVGLGYRTAGSLIPTIALQYTSWYVSLSYDYDQTEFNNLLESPRGGPEIHVRYIIKKVKPLRDRKICPIY